MSSSMPVCPCFTPGTLIATERGQVPVETLARGDKVVTRDNGLQRIYWIGRKELTYAELARSQWLRPVLIRAGALGDGRPSRDTLVSPNHRFLIETFSPLDRGPGEEVLIAARQMKNHMGVTSASVLGVSYIHILCSSHQVILANGAWTESFHPDDHVIEGMDKPQRRELLKLFPEIETIGAAARFPAARRILRDRSRFES